MSALWNAMSGSEDDSEEQESHDSSTNSFRRRQNIPDNDRQQSFSSGINSNYHRGRGASRGRRECGSMNTMHHGWSNSRKRRGKGNAIINISADIMNPRATSLDPKTERSRYDQTEKSSTGRQLVDGARNSKIGDSANKRKVLQHGKEYVLSPNVFKGKQKNNSNHDSQEVDEMNRQDRTRKYPMGFKRLEELVQKENNEILFTLCDPSCGFDLNLKSTSISRDMMALLLIAIGKACESQHRNNVMSLIDKVTKNKTFILVSVLQYLAGFVNDVLKPQQKHSLEKTIEFLKCFQQCLPASATEAITIILPLLRDTCKRAFADDAVVQKKVDNDLAELSTENLHFLQHHTPAEIKESSYDEKLHSQQPPESYRTIPVLPDCRDVTINRPFLRPNIVKGKYSDVDHYLDVQFRLLREDYVRPLREGINSYMVKKGDNKAVTRIENAKIYENVHILKQQFFQGLIVHTIEFDTTKLKNIKWEHSKRFLSGSLLCISADDFKTMYFASVVNRNVDQLKKGFIFLHFESLSREVMNFNPLTNFTIIETSAYFEAYRHNLDALQKMIPENFPFHKYIVSVEKEIDPPAYIDPLNFYDVQPLFFPLNTAPNEIVGAPYGIHVLKNNEWPSAEKLKLDDSQHAALKAAVTKEFAIIQGPPGTGKTYVGLRIVQLLLHNAKAWQTKIDRNPPILIVCYTNHALDQFLEGLSVFTKDIVRVGGRCTNDALAEFQLRNLKKSVRDKREVPHHIFSNIRHEYAIIGTHEKEMVHIQREIRKCCKSVVSEVKLRPHMTALHYRELKSLIEYAEPKLKDDNYIICDWLGTRFRCQDDFNDMENGARNNIQLQNGNTTHREMFVTSERNVLPHDSVPDIEAARLGEMNLHEDPIDNSENEDEDGGEEDIDVIEAMRDIETEDFSQFFLGIESGESEDDEIDGSMRANKSGWQMAGGKKGLKRYISRNLQTSVAMSETEVGHIKSILQLNINDRWRLYKYWLQLFIKDSQLECMKIADTIQEEIKKLDEMKMEEDLYVLQKAKIVGMTTTGAAKYRDLVAGLNPRIIVVEEAAEVLESHIVTALGRETLHVILIGDHQQLRPSPNVYDLAARFKMDISLFERLVKNGIEYYQLKIQHRMRPCISALLVPHIYPTLMDHESVHQYDNIKGVCKNMFFVTHKFKEDHVADSTSKVNNHEACFIVELCRYLLLQGYKAEQITILSTYAGQMFEIRRMTRAPLFKGVRVTVVDNFQGEENDIILMSFVRSNIEGKIGFLSISNRVCVALSRAKKGLFCIGNFKLLAEKCDLWRNILEVLKKQEAIGSSLKLQCQNHPETFVEVSGEKDFSEVREGGCSKPCEYRLKCGHTCTMMCHPYDAEHLNVRCQKPCGKVLCNLDHKCPLKCVEPCKPCVVRVEKILPFCLHKVPVPCHVPEAEFVCTQRCKKVLKCGHKCQNKCREECTIDCTSDVIVDLPCGHKMKAPCHMTSLKDRLSEQCSEPCHSVLQCGHICSGSCGKCHQGRLHVACGQVCKRILICGHECRSKCMNNCPPCKKKCVNRCVHSMCPKKCGFPCEMCAEPCMWGCKHYQCSKFCGEFCDRPPCDQPCNERLKCGHRCIGLCGEPCPNVCAICNPEVRDVFLGGEDNEDAMYIQLEDCGHTFEVNDIARWMEIDIKNESGEIKMKMCPRCNTVIRKNLHFGNVVKQCLANIEKVKKVVFGNEKRNSILQKLLHDKVIELGSFQTPYSDLKILDTIKVLLQALSPKQTLSAPDITKFENVTSILENFFFLSEKLPEFHGLNIASDSLNIQNCSQKILLFTLETCHFIDNFLADEVLTASEQQLDELTWEIQRLRLQCSFLEFMKKHNIVNFFQKKSETSNASYNSESLFSEIYESLCRFGPFRSDEVTKFNLAYESLSKALGFAILNVTENEKKLILKAMNLAKGHWYQCPNGHVYCITECGGAMEESKCNECGARIGGQHHALRSDNRVATAMDGSFYSAWPQANDLRNYEL